MGLNSGLDTKRGTSCCNRCLELFKVRAGVRMFSHLTKDHRYSDNEAEYFIHYWFGRLLEAIRRDYGQQ